MGSSSCKNKNLSTWSRVLPYWLYTLFLLLFLSTSFLGGWCVLIAPLLTWYSCSTADIFIPKNSENLDPTTDYASLSPYALVTRSWGPLQAVMLFGTIFYLADNSAYNGWEKLGIIFGLGVLTGSIGINFSHELMHQKTRLDRALADLLLGMVLYSHFRSEHLLVHHRYVGTPRDTVTARYNEGFHRFFLRVWPGGYRSSFAAERTKLARKDLPWWDIKNPFYLYAGLQAAFLTLSFTLGGIEGVVLFVLQAGFAIIHLELINYVEHYGLTRKHLGDGVYETVKPHHSWNADHRMTNYLLINLQRHSDHHYRPDRPFPLLQTYNANIAPLLPFGYGLMAAIAISPRAWRWMMNKKVRAWRAKYYPEITDWSDYDAAETPLPR